MSKLSFAFKAIFMILAVKTARGVITLIVISLISTILLFVVSTYCSL